MEFRSREKAIAMPNSFGFSSYAPPQNQESSSSSAKQLNLAAVAAPPPPPKTGEEEADDGDAIFSSGVNHQQQQHHNHSFHIQSNRSPNHIHQQNVLRSRRDSDTQDPKPSSDPTTRPSNAIVAAATTTTTTIAIATGVVRYRECLRNHAAHLAGHVVDGCGEFMPSGEEGTPESFKCAACDCHRNFHRKETDDEPSPPPPPLPPTTGINNHLTYHKHITTKPRNIVSSDQPVPPTLHLPPHPQLLHQGGQQQQQQQRVSSASPRVAPAPYQPTMMAFGGGAPSESSSEDLNMFGSARVPSTSENHKASRKRFRTKFTPNQKQKMMEFAEKLGWRIQKQDEAEVQQFCDEAGVNRQVFKVWMHNNKQAMKRKQ